jgi:cobalt-zinc-cadmium efflux system membrane fusion protein
MKRYNQILLFALSCALLTSCGKTKKAEEGEHEHTSSDMVEMTAAQITASGIELGGIEMRSMSMSLKVNGEIASMAQNMASVSMPMGGRIKSISLMPGASVRKGQCLAMIENSEFIDIQQQYLEAKSKLEYTAADYARQKELYRNDAASRKSYQLVTSEYKSLKAQICALEQKLLLIGINPYRLSSSNIIRCVPVKSPISGYIRNVNITIGKMVSSSDDLFDIVSLDNLFIKLTIFEKDIDKIRAGQHIKFYINDEEESHEAIVYQTSKSMDEDKTYKVYASIKSKCKNVLPGMYVNALIASHPESVPSLPDDAIVSFGGKDYIFVYANEKMEHGKKMTMYRMVQIKKGYSNGGYTQVSIPEETDTTKIVLSGAYSLLSAMKNAGEMSC